MTKQEFIEFCHYEFTNRGFKKKKKMYYLNGKDLLCGLDIQKSMGEAFYINYCYFIGRYDDIKQYPSYYDNDLSKRIEVLSKATYKGEHFMGGLIEYERYTKEELKPYFDEAFDRYIMPPITEGKNIILENKEYYLKTVFYEEKEELLNKLNT